MQNHPPGRRIGSTLKSIPAIEKMLTSFMHRALLTVLFAALGSVATAGELNPSTAPMKEKLQAVVRQQLEAFRRNDFAAAYKFAAKGITDQFPLAEFETMVRKGYPIVAASTDAVFGLTMDDGDRAVVSVRVIGKEKQSGTFQYLLERSGNEWRIAGVFEQEEKSETI
jgi:hypothetical protein